MNEYCYYEEMDAYEGWQEINEESEKKEPAESLRPNG